MEGDTREDEDGPPPPPIVISITEEGGESLKLSSGDGSLNRWNVRDCLLSPIRRVVSSIIPSTLVSLSSSSWRASLALAEPAAAPPTLVVGVVIDVVENLSLSLEVNLLTTGLGSNASTNDSRRLPSPRAAAGASSTPFSPIEGSL
jgi:hypothetical protein